MRKPMHLMALAMLVLSLHCTRPDKDDDTTTPNASLHINLATPAVGQRSYYVLQYDHNYLNSSQVASLTDTLLLSIVGTTEEGYLVEEEFLPSAQNAPSDWSKLLFPEAVRRNKLRYVLHIANNEMTLLPASAEEAPYSLIYDAVTDLRTFQDKAVHIIDGKPRESATWLQGYDTNFSWAGYSFGRVNVLIDNREIVTEKRGAMLIYNAPYGMIRKFAAYGYTKEGWVWQLVFP